jgi:hypothetical protein
LENNSWGFKIESVRSVIPHFKLQIEHVEAVLSMEWISGVSAVIWIARIILDSMILLVLERRRLLMVSCETVEITPPILIQAKSASSTVSLNTLRWQRHKPKKQPEMINNAISAW